MPERGIIAFKRWNEEGNIVVVVANLLPTHAGEIEISASGLEDGCWREVIYGYDVVTQQNKLIDTLGESDLKVYVKN